MPKGIGYGRTVPSAKQVAKLGSSKGFGSMFKGKKKKKAKKKKKMAY